MQKLTSIDEVTFEYIVEYCKENSEVDWLKETMSQPVAPDKRGRERRKSFIELRKEFTLKFMPEIAPKPAAPKKTMYDIIAEL